MSLSRPEWVTRCDRSLIGSLQARVLPWRCRATSAVPCHTGGALTGAAWAPGVPGGFGRVAGSKPCPALGAHFRQSVQVVDGCSGGRSDDGGRPRLAPDPPARLVYHDHGRRIRAADELLAPSAASSSCMRTACAASSLFFLPLSSWKRATTASGSPTRSRRPHQLASK